MIKRIFIWFIIPIFLLCLFGAIGFIYLEYRISDILNLGMFLLTYFLVIFAWESLEKSRKESYLGSRPYLIADFESEKGVLYFYIVNKGKTPAYGVKISADPDILLLDKHSFNSMVFENEIKFFPPKKIIKTIINTPSKFHAQYEEINIKITFKDSFGKTIEEVIEIDLRYRKKLIYFKNKDVGDLVQSLDKIKGSLDQLTKINDQNPNKLDK